MLRTVSVFLTCLLFVAFAQATTTDCQGVFVGRIWVEKDVGLKAVVFLNHPDDRSGSWWVFLNEWQAEDKKAALALLTSAKVARYPVNVVTTDASKCAIQTGQRHLQAVYMATNAEGT